MTWQIGTSTYFHILSICMDYNWITIGLQCVCGVGCPSRWYVSSPLRRSHWINGDRHGWSRVVHLWKLRWKPQANWSREACRQNTQNSKATLLRLLRLLRLKNLIASHIFDIIAKVLTFKHLTSQTSSRASSLNEILFPNFAHLLCIKGLEEILSGTKFLCDLMLEVRQPWSCFFCFISGKMVKLCSWYVRHIMTHIWLTLWLKNVGELFCTPHIQLFQRSNSTAVLDYTRKSEAPSKTKEILFEELLTKRESKSSHSGKQWKKHLGFIDTVDKGKQIVHAWSQPVNVYRVYPWRWTRILHLLTHKGSLQATKFTSVREVQTVDVRCVLIASPCPNLATACVHHPGKTVRSLVHTMGTSDHTECHKISTLEAPASTSPSPAQYDLESNRVFQVYEKNM